MDWGRKCGLGEEVWIGGGCVDWGRKCGLGRKSRLGGEVWVWEEV